MKPLGMRQPLPRIRHTLQKRDLLSAVMSDETFDFLIDITNSEIADLEAAQTRTATHDD